MCHFSYQKNHFYPQILLSVQSLNSSGRKENWRVSRLMGLEGTWDQPGRTRRLFMTRNKGKVRGHGGRLGPSAVLLGYTEEGKRAVIKALQGRCSNNDVQHLGILKTVKSKAVIRLKERNKQFIEYHGAQIKQQQETRGRQTQHPMYILLRFLHEGTWLN